MTEPTKDDGLGAVGALAGLAYTEGLDRNVEGRLRSRRAAWSGTPRQPTPEEQAVELGMEVVRLRAEHTRARREHTEELATLRRQVRGTLITRAVDGILTDGQLDQLLDDLDLPWVTREFEVEATLYARQRVKVTVQARDAEEARQNLLEDGWMAWEAATHEAWEAFRGQVDEDLVVGAATPVPGVIS